MSGYAVRMGRLRRLRSVEGPEGLERGGACVVETSRGAEWAELLWPLGVAPPGSLPARALTEGDERHRAVQLERDAKVLKVARRLVGELGSPCEVLAAEGVLREERWLVYYRSDDLVDWGVLNKKLGAHFAGPITWRQVGARQKASLCGGIGVCGREYCCSTFLRDMPPVTMRLAQRFARSLLPEDTAGACGRLKCCLRYELEENELAAPAAVGESVSCRRVSGTVVGVFEPGRTLWVEDAKGRRVEVFFEEIRRG